jgi:DNA-binding NarL/FixJ family response regulator
MNSNLENIFVQIPNFIFWKNIHSEFLGCNNNFAAAAGLYSPKEIRGKTDFDLPWADSHAELYQEGDHEVLDGDAKYNFTETQLKSNGDIISIIINKVPLLNQAGEKIGVIGSYMETMLAEYRGEGSDLQVNIPLTREQADCLYYLASGMSVLQISDRMHLSTTSIYFQIDFLKEKLNCTSCLELIKKAHSLGIIKQRLNGLHKIESVNEIKLSRREKEIIYYLVRGKTAKEIGHTIYLSTRTIENYLAAIKSKMGVSTKSDLIEKILDTGLLSE